MPQAAAGVLDRQEVALDTTTPRRTETPHDIRARLRNTIRDRGMDPSTIESITGDCEQQTAQQIGDLERWLANS